MTNRDRRRIFGLCLSLFAGKTDEGNSDCVQVTTGGESML
jgi:hypothetical protein